jgi:catechol 2,3-dioxygenase-like lactoylglutathione lyase family enzyme
VSPRWYTRPVIGVADLPRAVYFYLGLGFKQDWTYNEAGRPLVVQVGREGCELILSAQWPERVGHGLIFISLDVEVLHALRAELEGEGVAVEDGFWGYPLMGVRDPDGNTLYFPYPSETEGSTG